MEMDAVFRQGKTHDVCEDYALTAAGIDFDAVLVSDGCSGSSMTDFGSRLLTLAAIKHLKSHEDHGMFSTLVWNSAKDMITSLGLGAQALDATLLFAIKQGSVVNTYVYGDGCVAAKGKDGSTEIYNVNAQHGYPRYISYIGNPEGWSQLVREKLAATSVIYVKLDKDGNEIDDNIKSGGWKPTSGPPWSPTFHMTFHEDIYESVAVMSDGIWTFGPTMDVNPAEELLKFKQFRGSFAVRRMNSFLRSMEKKGMTPADDVSLAAIYLGDIDASTSERKESQA